MNTTDIFDAAIDLTIDRAAHTTMDDAAIEATFDAAIGDTPIDMQDRDTALAIIHAAIAAL